MRFKGKLSNENLLLLHNVIVQLQKSCIGNSAIIYLTKENIQFAVVSSGKVDNTTCCAEILPEALFTSYQIESQTENSILLEIGLENLNRALASGKHSTQCQLKLTKYDDKPYLSFESKSIEALSLNIKHDIPIRMHKPTDIIDYLPPFRKFHLYIIHFL